MSTLHILYLHQYFITREGVGSTRSYEFARYFVAQGHRVTIVTAQNAAVPWDNKGLMRRRNLDGIDVVEVRAGYANHLVGTKLNYAMRTRSFLQFALVCSLLAPRLPRPDVVFATSTPLTIGIPGLAISTYRRVPLVFEVRDLWPEAPIQMGALRNRLVIALARWLERTLYRRSRHVVALAPGIRDEVVAAGKAPDQVSLIPNASDLNLFSPQTAGQQWRTRLGVNGQFVCTYFGTMGEANDLTQVVEAAKLLQEQKEEGIVFVLCGDGKRRPQLETFCRDHQLKNVIFSDPVDKEKVPGLVAASDVCMTILMNLPVFYFTCSPNKLFDTFAAGRPALVNVPGWLQALVEEHEAGVYVRPDDPAHLAERVVFLRDHPDVVKTYGRHARRLAETQFDRRKLAAQLLSVLERVR